MKGRVKANEIGIQECYERLILPVLASTADTDDRRPNVVHSTLDALKSSFAIFHLKSSSLFSFQPKTKAEEENLRSIYQIEQIPSDNGLRNIVDRLDSGLLNDGFSTVIPFLESKDLISRYKYWNDHYIVSVDGVQHQCSKKVKCEKCLVRNHRDGSQSFSHSMLTGALVCPGQKEVFVVDNEPIINQDGQTKNDCERNAAKRFFTRQSDVNGEKPMIYVLDALYACAPIVKQISRGGSSWKYIINAKESGSKYLFEQFDELNEKGEIKWKIKRRKSGKYELGYANNLAINKANSEVKVNILYCNYTDPKGKKTMFSYITNIEMNPQTIMATLEMGRSRWKVENEVFNTLKNQQYNYEHNFGHGKKNLATNFAFLMMMAFTMDQIVQRSSKAFKKVHEVLKTRVKTWEYQRAIFSVHHCKGLDDLWTKLLIMCSIRVI